MEKIVQPLYFRGLDGLRGFAAMLVVFGHIEAFKHKAHLFNLSAYHLPFFQAIAPQGVNIFFTLSGFLITYLLLTEKAKTSDIAVGKFYVRRVFRIWPLFFLAVFLSFFLFPNVLDVPFFASKVTPDFTEKFLFTLFLLPNVVFVTYGHIFFHGVLWSIGSEEQFYLVWPHVIRKAKNVLRVLVGLLVTCIGAQYALASLHRFTGNRIFWILGSLLVFAPMIVGAIGAVLHHQGRLRFPWSRRTAGLLLGLIATLYFYNYSFGRLDRLVYSIIYLMLILNLIEGKFFLLNFDSRWMRYLGKISYGIYIFHSLPVVIAVMIGSRMQSQSWGTNIFIYVISVSLTIGLAHLSFTYFESWFLRMKEKYGYARVKAPLTSPIESQRVDGYAGAICLQTPKRARHD